MEKRYYVAYGSNLNIQQMKRRCPSAKIIGTSEIQDYRLIFKGGRIAYLTIEPMEGRSVPVAVWEVTAEDEAALDSYEGFPLIYYKAEMTLPVKARSGEIRMLDTFVYVMHEEQGLGAQSDFYLDICLEGYRDFGFDTQLLTQACDDSAELSEGRT